MEKRTKTVKLKKTAPKVAIVGYAPSRVDVPFADKSFDIWGMNDLWSALAANRQGDPARWNGWFELHNDETISSRSRTGVQAREWLKRSELPIVMTEARPDIPNSQAFPLDELTEKLNSGHKYFTSTPAYMIAMAIYLGYEEIWVYGVDLLGQDEYSYQRPCAEYWLGIARGSGIKVVTVGSALCLSNVLYGYDTHGSNWSPGLKLLDAKIQDQQRQLQQLSAQAGHARGAAEALGWARDMFAHESRGGHIPEPQGWTTPPADLDYRAGEPNG